ncbi:MAG: gliding motility-associated C-terminal domain-containing protein [Bacteroidia bacterium]|nr:gliding motility-associated C-terminal domain-containing protein [Bacteroidia bacterium]
MKTKLILLFIAIAIISCKRNNIESDCCSEPALSEQFTGGFIRIPNIFTPNGDGLNDILYVRGNGIKNLKFVIKTSLGKKLFETTDISIGWDGTYKNEKKTGIFKYELEVETINGDNIEKKGKVCCISETDYSINCENCEFDLIFDDQFNGDGYEPMNFKDNICN